MTCSAPSTISYQLELRRTAGKPSRLDPHSLSDILLLGPDRVRVDYRVVVSWAWAATRLPRWNTSTVRAVARVSTCSRIRLCGTE